MQLIIHIFRHHVTTFLPGIQQVLEQVDPQLLQLQLIREHESREGICGTADNTRNVPRFAEKNSKLTWFTC